MFIFSSFSIDKPAVLYFKTKYYPLSHQQNRLWFIQELDANKNVWNEHFTIPFDEPVNERKAIRTVRKLLKVHPVLRTRFKRLKSEPYQYLGSPRKFSVDIKTFTNIDFDEEREILQNSLNESFDLYKDSLFRFIIVNTHNEGKVHVVRHHIVSDGTSDLILIKDFLHQYYGLKEDRALSGKQLTYHDFIKWQANNTREHSFREAETYWLKEFSGKNYNLELPVDFRVVDKQLFAGGKFVVQFNANTSKKIRSIAAGMASTPYAFILSSLFTLFYRLSKQPEIVIGSPFSGRDSMNAFQRIVGLFVNTVAIKATLTPEYSFKELLKQVQKKVILAHRHQHYPFEEIVRNTKIDRSYTDHPIFQVWFNMLPKSTDSSESGENPMDDKLQIQYADNSFARFDLSIYCTDKERLSFEWTFNKSVFTKSHIEHMVRQHFFLLEQIIEDADRSLNEYSINVGGSTAQLQGEMFKEEDINIVDVFDSVAARYGEHIAVESDSIQKSYNDLRLDSQKIASAFVTNNVTKGDVIAIVGKRCYGLIAAMLGIFRSGGVLLIIDDNLPPERKRKMLDQANPKLLVTVGEEISNIAGFEYSFHIGEGGTMQQCENALSNASIDLAVGNTPIDLPQLCGTDSAYLFFTSGSTGTPKGILGKHSTLPHFVAFQSAEYHIGKGERVSQLTSLSFDVILREVFLALSSGATLVIPPNDMVIGSFQTLKWLDKKNITTITTVPSVVSIWTESLTINFLLDKLKHLFLSGEMLNPGLVKACRQKLAPQVNIVNFYGTTEAGFAQTYYQVPAIIGDGAIPVGIGMPENEIAILSDNDTTCGIGEIGEIVIRSPYFSKGYINDQVHSGFRPNPFGTNPKDEVYCTGDLGRYKMDGTIEILGRKDRQIKINGVRVETAEIEESITKFEGVSQCCVISRELNNSKVLVAFVVLKPLQEISLIDLREFLRNLLPNFMIPTSFQILEALPYNSNGKIDYVALQDIVVEHTAYETQYIPPQTDSEKSIATIWEQILQLKQVGSNDNFFDLGGHSLLAMKAMNRMEQELGIAIHFKDLIRYSVGQLAKLTDDQGTY